MRILRILIIFSLNFSVGILSKKSQGDLHVVIVSEKVVEILMIELSHDAKIRLPVVEGSPVDVVDDHIGRAITNYTMHPQTILDAVNNYISYSIPTM